MNDAHDFLEFLAKCVKTSPHGKDMTIETNWHHTEDDRKIEEHELGIVFKGAGESGEDLIFILNAGSINISEWLG